MQVLLSWSKFEFGNVGFSRGGKLEYKEKNSWSKVKTNNKLNPYIWYKARI